MSVASAVIFAVDYDSRHVYQPSMHKHRDLETGKGLSSWWLTRARESDREALIKDQGK